MKKILILGGGFTASKRLDPKTLQFYKALDGVSATPSPLGCPTCYSSVRAGLRGRNVYSQEQDDGSFKDVLCSDQWHDVTEDDSHNASLVKKPEVARCPECGSDDPVIIVQKWETATRLKNPCRNVFHTQTVGAPQVPERCPACSYNWHATKDYSGSMCKNEWHYRERWNRPDDAAPRSHDVVIQTIDINPDCVPTWCHDLNIFPWPVNDGNCSTPPVFDREQPFYSDSVQYVHAYDEIHAYEILEHLGQQGDFKAFFVCFAELWGALKPGGLLFASCPSWKSIWALGDPGHTRVISAASLVFLLRDQYARQIDGPLATRTAMTDYRAWLVGDWSLVAQRDDGESFRFVLRAK